MNAATVHRLLDGGAASALLAGFAGRAGPPSLEVESVWAKPGRYLNVCYRDADDGERLSLCVVGAAEGEKVVRRIARRDPSGAVMVAEDVLALRFPLDYRLPQLGDCLDPSITHGAVAGAKADACDVAAYRAGMRCQFRYRRGSETLAYGKISVEREPGRRRRLQQDLAAATSPLAMRVPAPLGSVESLGLDLVAPVAGRSLYEVLAESADAHALGAVGEALAELHSRIDGPRDRVHGSADELELLRSWAQWMTDVDPALARAALPVLAALEAQAPRPSKGGFAHRDFYDKQVFLDGPHLWLLDVDTGCTGDRELDLGNLLAHLFLRGLQWDRRDAHRALELAALSGYGRAARADATRWYRRASLVRLAFVYRLHLRWSRISPALVEEATR